MDFKPILIFVCAAILLAFATGHKKVALGIASVTVVSVLAFYAMILFALWNWTRRSSQKH